MEDGKSNFLINQIVFGCPVTVICSIQSVIRAILIYRSALFELLPPPKLTRRSDRLDCPVWSHGCSPLLLQYVGEAYILD